MSISIDFQENGKVRIFAMQDGNTVSVTTDANRMPALIPSATLETVRGLMAEFLDLTATGPKLKSVNPGQ